jgi:hypothetical protein
MLRPTRQNETLLSEDCRLPTDFEFHVTAAYGQSQEKIQDVVASAEYDAWNSGTPIAV